MASYLQPPASMVRIGVSFFVLASLATGAAACSTAAPPPNQTLFVCEAGDNGCAKKVDNTPKRNTSGETQTVAAKKTDPADTNGKTDTPSTTPPGPPPPPPPPGTPPPPVQTHGPLCTALMQCCINLRVAGITGSANQCDDTVSFNSESGCSTANDDYKTPDDNYDPVCF